MLDEPKKQPRILVVEDYETNREIIISYLSGDKYIVGTAEDGRQAIEAVKIRTYDLILMDIQMPGMDGYEAVRLIRGLESEGDHVKRETLLNRDRIPIIAMTAHTRQEDKDQCLAAGMDDYIGKPFRKKELLAMVEKWAGPQSG